MDTTPNLALPYIIAAQAQKHVTHNEAIRALDALVQLAVADKDLAAPPGSPADGARFIVGPSPSGAWTGHAGKVAAWQDGAWHFLAPREGWLAWVLDEDRLYAFDGAAWVEPTLAATVNPVALVGINATADTTNRLSLKSAASLFDNVGNGHQQKINKAAAGDTASQLFQTNYSGRAEIGLAGDDDLHMKVSADGSTWKDALQINRSTGVVSMPFTSLGCGPEFACRLAYVSSSQVKLERCKGRYLFINGVNEDIPSAGVTLANTGLTAATKYYIYAYMASGTMTLEASTTAHAVDATHGHRIKSGDATRTLVGGAYMDAGSPGTFADAANSRLVSSYYNRELVSVASDLVGSNTDVSSASYAEISTTCRTRFWAWGEAVAHFNTVTCGHTTATATAVYQRLAYGTAVGTYGSNSGSGFGSSYTAGVAFPLHTTGIITTAEGLNTATLEGKRDTTGAARYFANEFSYKIALYR